MSREDIEERERMRAARTWELFTASNGLEIAVASDGEIEMDGGEYVWPHQSVAIREYFEAKFKASDWMREHDRNVIRGFLMLTQPGERDAFLEGV